MEGTKYRISLSRKFIFYALIIVFLTFIYLSYLFIRESVAQNNEAISYLSAEASFATKIFDDSAKYTTLVLNSMIYEISKDPENKDHVKKVLKSFRLLHDSRMRDILSISMFSWVDKDDFLVVNSEVGVLGKTTDMSDRDYLKLTKLHPNKLFFGRPVVGAVSGQYIIPAGMGFVDKNGQYQGSVVMGFNIESIYQRFLNGKVLGSSNLQIIYKNEIGLIKNSLIFDNGQFAKIDPENPNLQILEESSILHSSSVSVYQKVVDTSYGFLVSTENFNESNIIKKSYLLEFLAVLAFLTILIYLLKKEFINPIVALSLEAEKVGNGNFDINTPESNISEISQLSKAIISVKTFVRNEQLLKQQLIRANTHLQSLTRSISHDLRNYIFGISGLAHLILGKKTAKEINEDEDLKLIQTIVQQSEEAVYFIEDLLDDTQTQTGNFTLGRIAPCDVADLMRRVILTSQNLALEHESVVIPDIENNLPFFRCDPRRMKQIFMNLISNAIKYNKENGAVRVKVARGDPDYPPPLVVPYFDLKTDRWIYIEVADEGIGMSSDEINLALSGEGTKIDKSALNKKVPLDSHGIGMSIIKHLVDLHQGKIEIESEKGVGTKVKLWFKVDDADHDNSENNSDSNANISTSHSLNDSAQDGVSNKALKVLVVDDNLLNLMIVKGVLNQANYQVIKATNGREAIETLEKNPDISLVIMDGQMSVMDGYETTRTIRNGIGFKNFTNYNIPIIALMGDDDEETIRKVKECGMDDHIKKSASVVSLIEMVARYTKSNNAK